MPDPKGTGLRRCSPGQRSSIRAKGDLIGLGGLIGQLLFPPSCLGCGITEAGYICRDCRGSEIHFSVTSVGECTLWTLGEYQGLLKKCITSVKDRGQQAVAEELALLAAETLAEKCPQITRLQSSMAVPSSRQGQRFRGFSLAQKVEEEIRKRFELNELPHSLRLQYRSSQKTSRGLGREGRLSKALEKPEQGDGKERGSLLLVDDVVTTGGTMIRAIEQAKAQGFSEICCFALAGVKS